MYTLKYVIRPGLRSVCCWFLLRQTCLDLAKTWQYTNREWYSFIVKCITQRAVGSKTANNGLRFKASNYNGIHSKGLDVLQVACLVFTLFELQYMCQKKALKWAEFNIKYSLTAFCPVLLNVLKTPHLMKRKENFSNKDTLLFRAVWWNVLIKGTHQRGDWNSFGRTYILQ